jgi:hypothetical protein
MPHTAVVEKNNEAKIFFAEDGLNFLRLLLI